MEKRFMIASLMLLASLTAATEEKTFQVEAFNSIGVSGAASVKYMPGKEVSVRAEGRAQDIARYEVKLKGDCLNICLTDEGKKNGGSAMRIFASKVKVNKVMEKVTFYVSGPASLRMIDLSGASHFQAEGDLQGDEILLDVSGASHLSCKTVTGKVVNVDCSGASGITCKQINATDLAELDVSGCSHCSTALQGGNVRLEVSGCSHGTLDLRCDRVQAAASGCSHITLSGSAGKLSADASGASSINRKAVKVLNQE